MPTQVDCYVGMRIKKLRCLAEMTQQALALQIGVRSQQIQKYESGVNRISAVRLWQVAKVLKIPVEEFFVGITEDMNPEESPDTERRNRFSRKEALQVVDLYYRLGKEDRQRMLEFAKSFQPDPDKKPN